MDDNSPKDIQQVADDEMLYRRLTVPNQFVENGDGSYRPSSALYKSTLGDISVDIASKTTPAKSIKKALALVGLLAKVPKDLGYPVVEDPVEEDLENGIEGNPAHALIKGEIKGARARKLAGESSWVIPLKD
ncbi:MAG: hypothetical protein K9M75_02660 [Phycisphaerae bacterium]|nr:hypothetical protein [Phycisphaerae bacterium]